MGLALLPLLALFASCATQDDPLSPAKPWTPPQTTISADFVEATQFLLKHGLADPRHRLPGPRTFHQRAEPLVPPATTRCAVRS